MPPASSSCASLYPGPDESSDRWALTEEPTERFAGAPSRA